MSSARIGSISMTAAWARAPWSWTACSNSALRQVNTIRRPTSAARSRSASAVLSTGRGISSNPSSTGTIRRFRSRSETWSGLKVPFAPKSGWSSTIRRMHQSSIRWVGSHPATDNRTGTGFSSVSWSRTARVNKIARVLLPAPGGPSMTNCRRAMPWKAEARASAGLGSSAAWTSSPRVSSASGRSVSAYALSTGLEVGRHRRRRGRGRCSPRWEASCDHCVRTWVRKRSKADRGGTGLRALFHRTHTVMIRVAAPTVTTPAVIAMGFPGTMFHTATARAMVAARIIRALVTGQKRSGR